MEKILKYSLILISLIISIGGIIYKVYALNDLGIFLNFFISISIFITILRLNKKVNLDKEKNNFLYTRKLITFNYKNHLTAISYLFLAFCLFYILFKSATTDSIISPWEKIPNYFFIIYFLATIIILINIFNKKAKGFLYGQELIFLDQKKSHSSALLTIHYFLSFSIATFVYKLGYGFDPYIHEAAINHTITHGFISPKTFYYAGYYSLIISLHKISLIPVFLLNKFIVPFMAALFLPSAIINVFQKHLNNSKIKILTLSLLILPFNIFILSTPQNLAYLFLMLSVIFSLNYKNYLDLILIFLLAFSAFIIQPIAGIPAIIMTAYIAIFNLNNNNNKAESFLQIKELIFLDQNKIKKYLYFGLFILSSFLLPLLFLVLNKNNPNFNKKIFNNIFDLNWLKITFPQQENIWLNFIYFFDFNRYYFIILLIILGIVLKFIFKKYQDNFQHFFIYLLMSISSLVSYFFIIIQPFDFLISYERSDYANRIIVITFIFFTPFIFLAIYKIINNILIQNKNTKIILAMGFSLLLTINLYTAYPRLDNYHNSHGTSTSADDIMAVRWINNDANGNDFIVLANQQVSAAALHEFEFKKYYAKNNEAIFYYSIPTGGTLYQYYLKMTDEKPSKKNANEAMDTLGVKTVYFVLNKYWWSFSKISEEAKNEADSYKNINDKVYVFKYTK